MARYTPNSASTIPEVNQEFEKIEQAMDDTLSRKGDAPNTMESDLDMNSNRVYNLPDAKNDKEPATLAQLKALQIEDAGASVLRTEINNGTVQIAGQVADRIEQNVSSLVDLLDRPHVDGSLYQNIGFYPDSTVGGGKWKAVTGADLTKNNGGTFVSVAALQAWKDAAVAAGGVNTTNLQANLNVLFTAGTGTGDAFVRVGTDGATKFSYRISWFGVNESTPHDINADIFQYIVDKGAVIVDTPFSYNKQVVVNNDDVCIKSGTNTPIEITWTGPDSVYALAGNTAGVYRLDIDRIELKTSGTNKLGFDSYRVRDSRFYLLETTGFKIGVRLNSQWYNKWTLCKFRNKNSEAGSIGAYFQFISEESFGVINNAEFDRCNFNSNENGIVVEQGGDGIVFQTCAFEENINHAIVFQGQGSGRAMTFCGGCYIEKNGKSPILWKKNLAGNFYGVNIESNYFGMESTARAGLIEFQSGNGGTHHIIVKNNSFRNIGGLPSESVLLDVNGATMSGIYIEWIGNTFGEDVAPASVAQFKATAVDWRYMRTDVAIKLNYLTNFSEGYNGGSITVSTPEFGKAEIVGTFKFSGAFTGAQDITDAMPLTIRPAGGIEQFPCYEQTDLSSEGTLRTLMINAGKLRTAGVTNDIVSFHHSYYLPFGKSLRLINL